jgi:transposase InsO family protein
MISAPDRQEALALIEQSRQAGARLEKVCGVLGIHPRTHHRWRQPETATDRRPTARRPKPANSLTEAERLEILAICNQAEHRSLPPSQIVPRLADQNRYVASESSFYRVLRAAGQSVHRGRTKPSRKKTLPKTHIATVPNQVWSWDITYLNSTIAGRFFRLYLILDIFSRKVVGWEVHENESADNASLLISKACLAEAVSLEQLVLHSDNGSPMKGSTMLTKLQQLGIIPSFSRPSVSNDNAYSESLFRHLKYTPAYPARPFETIDAARLWVHRFVTWYNHVHKHSGLKFVTPDQRHRGQDTEILARRQAVYEAAKARRPERWSGSTRNWEPVLEVTLNPQKKQAVKSPDLESAA